MEKTRVSPGLAVGLIIRWINELPCCLNDFVKKLKGRAEK